MNRKPLTRGSFWLAFSASLAGCGQVPAATPPAGVPANPVPAATAAVAPAQPEAPAAINPPSPAATADIGPEATASADTEPVDKIEEPEFVEISESKIARKVSQVGMAADPELLGQIPPEIPMDLADQVLSPLDPAMLAQGMAADPYQGVAGAYTGLPPSLMQHFLGGRVRVLYVGGVLVPFVLVGYRWVPLAFLDRRSSLYIYPTFVGIEGGFAPVYYASPRFYDSYRRHRRWGRQQIVSRLGFLGSYRPRIPLPRHKLGFLREHVRKQGPWRGSFKFKKVKRWR